VQKVALTDIREAEIRIDLMILPVEEAYVMLNKYQLTFNDGNAERVDTISYSWKLLKQQVSISFSCHLTRCTLGGVRCFCCRGPPMHAVVIACICLLN